MDETKKIGIDEKILNKPGKLTKEEFEIMKTHTIRECELLDSVPRFRENPVYKYAYDICRHHHERWDGRGYPDGLKENEISIFKSKCIPYTLPEKQGLSLPFDAAVQTKIPPPNTVKFSRCVYFLL